MMKGICLGEKANQKSSREPAIGRAGASVFASFKPENEKPSAQDLMRAACFSHHFAEIDILPRPVVQPKLIVGPPGDKYEQEADRVAERFIGMQKPCPRCWNGSQKDSRSALWLKSIDNQISHLPQREGKKGAPQTGKVDRQAFQLSPQFETEIRSSKGGGQPLQKSAHNLLEPWFGSNLSDVRVHTDFRSSEVAKSVNAIAFTTGKDVFFSRGSYDPASNKGLRLIAHELTHVLQQTDGRHSLEKTDDLILQRTPAGDLIDEHTSRGNLDEVSLGRILSQRARQGDYDIIDQVLNELGSTNRDDVSYELMRQTNDAHLIQFAQSFPGRRMLDRLYDELSSGSFSEEERRQANRIIDVRQTAIRPSERPQSLAGMKIFPFKLPGLTVFEDSPIMAERRPTGRIRVELPNRVFSYERYRAETRTLPIDVFIGGIELPENETIGVRMYDLGGVLHVRPAIYLVQLANESTTRVFVTAGEAAALGLTMGSGALAAGAARGSTAVRALVRLGFSAERAGRVIVWADRAALSIGIITTAIRDHRGWIIQRFGDSGRQFLDYVDFVQRAVAVYGIARCAIELGGLIANFRSAIARWRRSPAQSDTGLNANQRQALDTINRNTDEFLDNVDQIQGARGRTEITPSASEATRSAGSSPSPQGSTPATVTAPSTVAGPMPSTATAPSAAGSRTTPAIAPRARPDIRSVPMVVRTRSGVDVAIDSGRLDHVLTAHTVENFDPLARAAEIAGQPPTHMTTFFRQGTITNSRELYTLIRQALQGLAGRRVVAGVNNRITLTIRNHQMEVWIGPAGGGMRVNSIYPLASTGRNLTAAQIRAYAADINAGRRTLDEVRREVAGLIQTR